MSNLLADAGTGPVAGPSTRHRRIRAVLLTLVGVLVTGCSVPSATEQGPTSSLSGVQFRCPEQVSAVDPSVLIIAGRDPANAYVYRARVCARSIQKIDAPKRFSSIASDGDNVVVAHARTGRDAIYTFERDTLRPISRTLQHGFVPDVLNDKLAFLSVGEPGTPPFAIKLQGRTSARTLFGSRHPIDALAFMNDGRLALITSKLAKNSNGRGGSWRPTIVVLNEFGVPTLKIPLPYDEPVTGLDIGRGDVAAISLGPTTPGVLVNLRSGAVERRIQAGWRVSGFLPGTQDLLLCRGRELAVMPRMSRGHRPTVILRLPPKMHAVQAAGDPQKD